MLSLFPQLFFLAPFSASLIRLAVAAVFMYTAWVHWNRQDLRLARGKSIVEGLCAIALVLGYYVQAAAIVSLVISIMWAASPARPIPLSTTLLTIVMCLSLLVTGAGLLAFDLPL